jgi:hypothetical protein
VSFHFAGMPPELLLKNLHYQFPLSEISGFIPKLRLLEEG